MLTPEWYEACTDQILILYSRLEDDILKDIVRRLLKTDMVTDTAKWQAEMLEEAGLLYNDIIQKIAKHTPQTADELRLLFEDAGTEVMKNDNIIAESATGKELHLSDSKLKILKANYRNTLGNLRNLTNTTAMTSQAAFIAACNDAHMQITSGAFSYQEAVRNAIRRAVRGGLTVKYPTGHIDKLDVAVRRAALTGVGQTAAKISIMNAEEMDCDLMEITAHAGARPEHAKWQGKLVSRTGKNVGRIVDGVRVLSLADIGYGTGAGFRGWNCRHDWYPYFPGLSTPNYSKEQLEKLDEKNIEYDGQMYSQYEISQMQRAQERKIRELKRQTVKMQDAADFATDPKLKELAKADHQTMSVKLKTAEKELKDFCKATGQDRDKFREQVLGFSRSEAQRAVQAAKRQQTMNHTGSHTVEVVSPTPKKNSGTGKIYQPEEVSGKLLTSGDNGGIIKETTSQLAYKKFNTGEEVNKFFGGSGSILQKKKSTEGRWFSSLSLDEKKYISDYCADGYGDINDFLRKSSGWENIGKEYVENAISSLDSAIKKFELTENITVHRGVGNDVIEKLVNQHGVVNDLSELVGKIYEEPGYSSTTALFGNQVAKSKPTVFEFDIPAGKGRGAYVNKLAGQFKDVEYEFLIKRGAKFKITAVEEDVYSETYVIKAVMEVE